MDAVVLHIYIAPEAGAPMQGVEAAHAVPGLGLEGDRYHRQAGSFSRWPGPHRELTLIAEEDLAAMHRETGLLLPPEASRRNVLTRGVDLRTLIGCEFAIGPVRLRGMQRCQPCKYLARRAGLPGLVRALSGRSGIRARILTESTIRVGDAIVW